MDPEPDPQHFRTWLLEQQLVMGQLCLPPYQLGLALKNPPKKTHPKNPKKRTQKNPLKMFFFGFFKFLIFYENNTNFSLSNRFFMNK
jgi:hypothetical protein